jgi:phosphate-selective porin OprO and OprP
VKYASKKTKKKRRDKMNTFSVAKKLLGKVIVGFGILGFVFSAFLVAGADAAGVTVYKDGEKYVKMGGRIQIQYYYEDPDSGDSEDEVDFRRLRPYIEGSIHKNWKGKFQWDMGGATGDNEIAIKDAYMQYKGVKNMKITIGNANFPFSRELLTSSKKQQLVERTFVGDHNYGTPDRSIGLHITGNNGDKKLTYGVSGTSASIDPDAKKLDFDTPVNRSSDFNEGWLFGGRVDFHPFGHLKMSQGDFKGKTKATIGISAFVWDNDDDNNTRTTGGVSDSSSKPDVDSVTGFEVSAAFRCSGFSVDAQYNLFNAETIDSSFTGGIYENGETDLENFAIEGGYMVVPKKLEVVAGYQAQDADGYSEEWTRTSFGLNYFIEKHDIKIQGCYRIGKDKDGVDGNDLDEIFIQAQYVF